MAKFTSQEFQPQILHLLKAGYQVIAVECYRSDHLRAVQWIADACSKYDPKKTGDERGTAVLKWNAAHGFTRLEGPELALIEDPVKCGYLKNLNIPRKITRPAAQGMSADYGPVTNILEALEIIGVREEDSPIKTNSVGMEVDCAVILKWSTKLLNDHPIAGGILADLSVQNNFNARTHVRPLFLILQDGEQLSPVLASHVHLMQLVPPTKEDLSVIFHNYVDYTVNPSRRDAGKPLLSVNPDLSNQLVSAMQGLAYKDAEDCLSYSFQKSQKDFNPDTVRVIQDYKNDLMRTTASIKPVPWSEIPEEQDVAGMELLITWLKNRARAFQPWAEQYRIDRTRAILLAGVPGCGKTLIAKVMSRIFNMPLYHLDWGSMKSKYVGESDRALRHTLMSIEAMHHGVFFIDEIEKALSGSKTSGGDSGLQRSMFGYFNQWLTEHKANAVIVAACNSMAELPPELIRRFDEIWGVGLPNAEEVWSIIQIRCRQKGIDGSQYNSGKDDILAAMHEYTGADVIKAFNEAHFLSLDNPERGGTIKRGTPSIEQLIVGATSIKPLIKSDPDSVRSQMDMISTKARPVSAEIKKTATPVKRGRGGEID